MNDAGASDAIRRSIAAIWQMESGRILGRLTRVLRDVGLAEEMAQEAFVSALEQWPRTGLPDNPGAWLMTTARNRALDHLRRLRLHDRKSGLLAADPEGAGAQDAALEQALAADVPDDLLRLIFIACHPVLPTDARLALTLRLLGGLTAAEIGRAFLAGEAAIQQRIVRAKRTLAEARVPFELPKEAERAARLASVLEVIYLMFNEGYVATAGEHWLRPALCEEAQRLGRVLAQLVPEEPEVHGLVALMEIQASRNRARVGPGGEPILLLDQDRARWDPLMISRGLAALGLAERVAGGAGSALGPYALQAAIAACHARAPAAADTDWARIVALYDALSQVSPSPVVALNRAVALAMAYGPAAGLASVDALAADARLQDYHLLPSVRGDLLEKLGRFEEASAEFARAAQLTLNLKEQELLRARERRCGRCAQDLH
ncbi:MAG: RNA polymerase sigma factor [Steroidobacteraceae bacterium]